MSSSERIEYQLLLFSFQYQFNAIYRQFCDSLHKNPNNVLLVDDIPHLPISAFKHHKITTGNFREEIVFYSSGTKSSSFRSKHYLANLNHYLCNTTRIWNQYFDISIKDCCFIGLLPGYLERTGSSLIAMVQHFMNESKHLQNGFFLNDYTNVANLLELNYKRNIPTVLFGIPYALMDLIDHATISFPELIVVETGGMKGQRAEIPKSQLYQIIEHGLGTSNIYSEYGMTELLSQTYAGKNEVFTNHNSLIVNIYQISDPLEKEKIGRPGLVAVNDLANIDSCAFIQTEDLGISIDDTHFTLAGRLDNSDIRGCNLLMEEIL